jgi:hypothetical protein
MLTYVSLFKGIIPLFTRKDCRILPKDWGIAGFSPLDVGYTLGVRGRKQLHVVQAFTKMMICPPRHDDITVRPITNAEEISLKI